MSVLRVVDEARVFPHIHAHALSADDAATTTAAKHPKMKRKETQKEVYSGIATTRHQLQALYVPAGFMYDF